MDTATPRRRCTATNRAGQRCGRAPAPGALVCATHGGKAPQVQRKAAERVAEQEVTAMWDRYRPDQSEPLRDPLNALLGLAGQIVAFKDFLAGRVAEMRAETWRYGTAQGEQLRAEVALFERAMDRAARVLVDINRLGLEERQVRLAEQQGALVAQAIRNILAALSLTPDQAALVPTVVPRELRAIASEAAS